jgi:hypothetical protein
MPPVSADYDSRTLCHGRTAAVVSANSGDATIFSDNFLYGERFTNLGAGIRCGIDQDLVENCPARRIRHRLFGYRGRSADSYRPEIEGISVYRGTIRADHGIVQTPSLERRHPLRMNEVCRDGVAGESCPVYNEDFVTSSCQKHCDWRAGTSSADDYDVVLIRSHFSSLLLRYFRKNIPAVIF